MALDFVRVALGDRPEASAIVCVDHAIEHWHPGDRVAHAVAAEVAGGCDWHAKGRHLRLTSAEH